jgi:hypothetical protein
MIIEQNYAGNEQKSYKIMKIQMFAALDKTDPYTEIYKILKLGGGQACHRSSD